MVAQSALEMRMKQERGMARLGRGASANGGGSAPPAFRIAVAELLTMARPLQSADISRLECLVIDRSLSVAEHRDLARLISRTCEPLAAEVRVRLESLAER